MAEFKEIKTHSLSEENVGPIVFKYCWKPSGITKNEFETIPFIKQELKHCKDIVFCNKNDEQTWNDNVTVDEIDIKTELSVTFDSEQTDESDSGFNLLAEQLQRLAENQYNISSAENYGVSHIIDKPIHAEETAVEELQNAPKITINKKKKRQKNSVKDQLFMCSHCPYKSLRKHCFNNHVRSHKAEIPQVFICDHCHFITLAKKNLRRHISSHNLPTQGLLKCDHCNYSANSKYPMARHMLTHLKTFPISCDLCSYKCNTYYQLKIHNKTKHKKTIQTRTKLCEICGKVISSLCNVATHLLTHKEGPHFFCQLCPYSGRCRKRYKMHVLTHSEDYKAPARHACAMCDYTSEQLRHVRRHAIVHVTKTSGVQRRRRRTNKKNVKEIS